jgi:two-component system cell cycle sensor histidine kinase/response regulator CckA
MGMQVDNNTTLYSGRVLIMDDDEVVLKVAGSMLSHLGLMADFATHGEEAINLYAQSMKAGRSYDLVIMDLTIPGKMGGKEAIARLKEIDPKVKAIVSSGYSNDPVMANYSNYGFSGVIAKPYRMEDLKTAINSVFQQD